jgi:flavin-binding protein dodecin
MKRQESVRSASLCATSQGQEPAILLLANRQEPHDKAHPLLFTGLKPTAQRCPQGGWQMIRCSAQSLHHHTKEGPMSVAKIIEISCESPKSFEDAVQSGIARASKTIHNIKGAWVKEQQVVIDNNKISMYRVDLKVTFVLD